MTTHKPTIFLSHSSRDKQSLIRLKSMLSEKTNDTMEIFLSTDGESIQLGRNWVHKIQDALERAKIVFVFLSPASLQSKWLYFESGFSYSKGIRVIPVGVLGVDLQDIPPPLGLLQGFNIRNHEGLNNIIHILNGQFQFSFGTSFSPDDYNAIFRADDAVSVLGFDAYTPLIDRIQFAIQSAISAPLDIVKKLLDESNVTFQETLSTVHSYGVTFTLQKNVLVVSVDPGLAGLTFPIVQKVYQGLDIPNGEPFVFQLWFGPSVTQITEHFKTTSKIYGSGITLAPDGFFVFGNLEFKIDALYTGSRSYIVYLHITLKQDQLDHRPLVELLRLLFDREIFATKHIK